MEELLRKVEELGISLVAQGEQLDIYDPANALTDDLLNALKDNKEALLHLLQGITGDKYIPIPRTAEKKYYHLSAAQRRLYFQYEFDKTSLAYNIPQAVTLTGKPDKARIKNAFTVLLDRHEIFRTAFEMVNDLPMQQVLPPQDFDLEEFHADNGDVKTIIHQFIRPFDLHKPPLFRAGLISVGPDEHVLVVDMHHIASDGVSAGILIRDFMAIYNEEVLAPLPLQYKDFAEWQQSPAQQQFMAAHKQYWVDEFMEVPGRLELPADFPRPLIKEYSGSSVTVEIDAATTEGLRAIAEQDGATMFMVMLSLFNVLLSKLSNQQDIVIGSVTAGRQHPDLANMFGMFANTLVLRNEVKGALSFKELLAVVKTRALQCFSHQYYPYEELVEQLRVERDTSRNPLFDVLFAYNNFEPAYLEMPGLTLQPCSFEPGVAKFDLTLTVTEQTDTMKLSLEYATSIFKAGTIEKFMACFHRIINAVLANPFVNIADIDILSEAEREQVLHGFNNTKVSYAADKTVIDLFEEQVLRTPTNTAIICEEIRISYQALNTTVNKLAHYLREKLDIKPNDLIGVMLPRTESLIVSILAILKAGAAYVPIDPNYPEERIQLITTNSGLKAIIGLQTSNGRDTGVPLVSIIAEKNFIAGQPDTNPEKITGPDDLIYVIYTSGSTGVPKGAMIRHHSFTNLIEWYRDMLNLSPADVMLLLAPVSFDLAQKNIFSPLAVGAPLCLSEKLHLEYNAIAETVKREGVTIVNLAPSAFYPLLEEEEYSHFRNLQPLRKVVLGGEPIHTRELDGWRKSAYYNASIINSYGPTECTDVVSWHELSDYELENAKSIPIGKALNNTQLYILDQDLKPVPVGVIGDVYIGGVCVGNGYLNNSQLTAEKFVKNPFDEQRLIYRTGDLGKWLPEGNIVFTGRNDDQVKIRGFRIELSEITNNLTSHPMVKDAVVLPVKKYGNEYLSAYYTAEEDIPLTVLRSFLTAKLPGHMVPAYYVHLKSLPLNPNGKLDKKALPEPDVEITDSYAKPETNIQSKLVEIWSRVLNINSDKISIYANFFDLGGHSLKIIQLNRLVNEAMNVNISVANTFRLSNISLMADFIVNGDKKTSEMEKEFEDRGDFLNLLSR